MEIRHTSNVETTVTWIATLKLHREEFDKLIKVLTEADESGSREAGDLLTQIREAGETPDIGWPVRPITQLKRKAVQNGMG